MGDVPIAPHPRLYPVLPHGNLPRRTPDDLTALCTGFWSRRGDGRQRLSG